MANIKDIDPYEKISILSEVSESLALLSPEEFLQTLPEKVCQLLHVPICILWKAKQEQKEFQILATAGKIDGKYKKMKLDFQHPGVRNFFKKNKILSLADVNQSIHRFGDLEEINQRGFVSFMSAALKFQGKMLGIIDVFTTETHDFQEYDKKLFTTLSNYANLSFQKIEALQEKEKIYCDRQKLQELTKIIHDMTAASQSKEIWQLLKKGVEKIVTSKYIWIGSWNHLNGELELVESNNSSQNIKNLKFGTGIITQVIKNEKAILISDISNAKDQYINHYVQSWNDTKSEFAIPLIDTVLIREKTKIKKFGSKIIGVLNIESTNVNSFSPTDKERIVLLARHASIRLERLRFYQKIYEIRKIEKEISEAQNSEKIIKIIINGIRDVLKFEWINISLVNSERTQIQSKHVVGISKEKEKKFKREATHSLESNDIQADLVRSKNIEVPDNDDPRLNRIIFNDYGHQELIRVFLPMIEPSSDLVIGTVEVGYKRKYRKYIYEQDVQILKSFVDYAVHALERRKSGLIDKITHELKSPIVGIKANASYLQTHFNDIRVSPQKIAIKFEDILTDCELLTYQIRQFEYFLGKSNVDRINLEEIVVFRDIVIKTIHQLKFYMKEEYGFLTQNIIYDKNDSQKIIVNTDKIKLNQVIFNIFINAFKYAKKDKKLFKIELKLEEDKEKNKFIIKFQDWGIGINKEDTNKIFEEGFRSSEAITKVGGSGLGLSISRNIMRQLGGDLKLIKNHDPTEFHLILPQKIGEE